MRFIALLSLSALLTGCCQTRVAERHCGSQPGCKTDCPAKQPCAKSRNPCGMTTRDKRCCDPPQGYACRSSLTLEWKPVKYPVLRRKKLHEVCGTQKPVCGTGCQTDGLIIPHGQAQYDRSPFVDAPVLDPPPLLNPPQSTDEATIPGVDTSAQPGADQLPPPQDTGSDSSSAAYDGRSWTPQTAVPEIQAAPSARRTASRGIPAYDDQRSAVEMWPYSPQYTGRR